MNLISIGHRGARGHAPENTLLSFEKGISLGAEWLELDIQQVENQFLVFHDETLERTTNGTGRFRDQTVAKLRSLDAGQGEKIPFLTEVLNLCRGRAALNIEIKDTEIDPKLFVTFLKDQLTKGWLVEDLLISSFDHTSLKKIRTLMPELKIGALLYGIPHDLGNFITNFPVYSVHPSAEFITKEFVDDLKTHDVKIFVYTVNDPVDIRRMKDLGVDGVFSDYPERVR